MTRGQVLITGLGAGIVLGVVAAVFAPWLTLIFIPVGLTGMWFSRRKA